MATDLFSDTRIVNSWHRNAAPWIEAIRGKQIESRIQVTNQAIIEAIVSRVGKTVIDIGCGEGWLVRELHALGMNVLGTDAVPDLIEQARATGAGHFDLISHEDIGAGKLGEKFDVAVCNFSLLGNESVTGLFRIMPMLLNATGCFIVQTVHPVLACGAYHYESGWREGSWLGFSSDFTDPAPLYFRTLEAWISLFIDNGLKLIELREPLNQQTGKPASVLFMATLSR